MSKKKIDIITILSLIICSAIFITIPLDLLTPIKLKLVLFIEMLLLLSVMAARYLKDKRRKQQ